MHLTATRLRMGEDVADDDFDLAYPPWVRVASFRHWTRVKVARQAANLLAGVGAKNVLDIGAGPGKFCIVGALSTSAHFTGVEQRQDLVEVAQNASFQFGMDRTRFVHANLVDFDCSSFDGFYLYNPFQEQIKHHPFPNDDVLRVPQALYNMYVASTIAQLSRAPIGTAVVTYNGFGAAMPRQYHRLHWQEIGGAELVLWIKMACSRMIPGEVFSDR